MELDRRGLRLSARSPADPVAGGPWTRRSRYGNGRTSDHESRGSRTVPRSAPEVQSPPRKLVMTLTIQVNVPIVAITAHPPRVATWSSTHEDARRNPIRSS